LKSPWATGEDRKFRQGQLPVPRAPLRFLQAQHLPRRSGRLRRHREAGGRRAACARTQNLQARYRPQHRHRISTPKEGPLRRLFFYCSPSLDFCAILIKCCLF
jgi:hypothetical protein